MLSTETPLLALNNHSAATIDEMNVAAGDYIVASFHYLDGWCYGFNLSTGQTGAFPLPIASPEYGSRFKLTLINVVSSASEIIGKDLIDGALLAYPKQISVHYFIEDGNQAGVSGFVYPGKFDASRLDDIVELKMTSRKFVVNKASFANKLIEKGISPNEITTR